MTSALTETRLRKAAADNGFDLEEPTANGWLYFASTKVTLKLWLSEIASGRLAAGFSDHLVVSELASEGHYQANSPLGASAVLIASDFEALHHFLRRAFQLSRALPDGPLRDFETQAADLPRSTEAERLVVLRIGQGIYRQGLIDYWEGRCAISGLDVVELLRASHCKPWADCESDAERLDIFNGFLLAPHLDALFDAGFITIARDGNVLFSRSLSELSRASLGLADALCVSRLTDNHRGYLAWHAEHVFRNT